MPPCKTLSAPNARTGPNDQQTVQSDKKSGPSHPEQLQEMQSPRLPLVFILTMLLEIQARVSQQANLLSSPLFHFFTTLERAMCDENFNQYPHRLENILMAFIRGFDIGSTPCPASSELCLLHGDSDRDRFPPWPLVFSVMKVISVARRLSYGTRRALERELSNVLLKSRWMFET
jgi:hypothetical protein